MNIQEIKLSFNRGRMDIDEIKWLINTLDMRHTELIEAFNREASYIDDIEQMEGMLEQANKTIEQYQLHETILRDRLKKQTLEIKEMKNDRRLIRFWELAEENLKLAQKIAELEGVEPVGNQSR